MAQQTVFSVCNGKESKKRSQIAPNCNSPVEIFVLSYWFCLQNWILKDNVSGWWLFLQMVKVVHGLYRKYRKYREI